MKNLNILTRKGSSRGEAQKEQAVRSAKMLGVGAALLILSGCSTFNIGKDEYSCPGMPNGVQCMSARDVYAATGTVAKLAMRQPFVLFKGLTFQKLCLPGAFR
ncbi:TraV family lipoprotein, partial [Salmonella enterica]|uniref:TraV family lipoprotein n=1 Tax=Salmonella enterica TaxID=28901 RepID=UPI0020CA7486